MNDEKQERQEFVRRLFGTKPEPEEPGGQKGNNYVPSEGSNPEPPRGDRDLREFARQLFDCDND